jgi:hypothetical protein
MSRERENKPPECDRIFTKTSDKEQLLKIREEPLQLNNDTTTWF